MKEFFKALRSPSFADDWEKHKGDYQIWRKFWALWELRKVWTWADSYYKSLDRTDNEIVAPEWWSRESGGKEFLNLCLWLSFLQSVLEGIEKGLNDFDSKKEKTDVDIREVLGPIPDFLSNVHVNVKSSLRIFRNAVFHCQWTPNTVKLNLNQETTNEIDILHNKLGKWIKEYFNQVAQEFRMQYNTPNYWIGVNFMEDDF
ncbi:MAG: hypothetical protein HOD64_02075 [Candidatus Cloacimonetes bacterium]|nr:hypothetical protein [Candidatus Cloacimonadota bacterium]